MEGLESNVEIQEVSDGDICECVPYCKNTQQNFKTYCANEKGRYCNYKPTTEFACKTLGLIENGKRTKD